KQAALVGGQVEGVAAVVNGGASGPQGGRLGRAAVVRPRIQQRVEGGGLRADQVAGGGGGGAGGGERGGAGVGEGGGCGGGRRGGGGRGGGRGAPLVAVPRHDGTAQSHRAVEGEGEDAAAVGVRPPGGVVRDCAVVDEQRPGVVARVVGDATAGREIPLGVV